MRTWLLPQQTTAPLPAWIAQLWPPPAAIAEAVPAVPSTDGGGVASPETFPPQQTTAPPSAWIAQLWPPPAAIAEAVPAVPSTDGGGVASPETFPPQQTTAPLSAWIAQLWVRPCAIAEALIFGKAPAPHATTGPAPRAALAASTARPRPTATANVLRAIHAAARMLPPRRHSRCAFASLLRWVLSRGFANPGLSRQARSVRGSQGESP